jgi:lysozyme family protein
MANWNTAYNWMMDNEDAPRACVQVPDAPPGASAISGINSAAWPEEFAAIAALPQPQREPMVQQFYQDHFWNRWYEQLDSDDVAKRVFDFAVNAGSGPAVRSLQQAVNSLTSPDAAQLVDDGEWGPTTLGGVNSADPQALVEAFQAKRIGYYKAISTANPVLAQYLPAWTLRAQK